MFITMKTKITHCTKTKKGKENKAMKVNQNNEKFVPTEEQIKAECQQRARYFWNWLTWSLVYYVVINLFLVAVNWFTSPHYWWVLWVIAGWGISLLITAIEKSIKY